MPLSGHCYWPGLGDLELRSIAEGLVPKEAAGTVGQLRQPTHVPDDSAQLCCMDLASGGVLQGSTVRTQ